MAELTTKKREKLSFVEDVDFNDTTINDYFSQASQMAV